MCEVGEKYLFEAIGYFTICSHFALRERERASETPKNEQHAPISQSPGRKFDRALPLLHVLTDTDNLRECEIIRWKNLKVLRQSRKIESYHAAATIPRTMGYMLPWRELSCKHSDTHFYLAIRAVKGVRPVHRHCVSHQPRWLPHFFYHD